MPPSPVLVDTSAWILGLRKRPAPIVRKRLDQLLENDQLFVVAPVKLELLSGTKTRDEYDRLEERLNALKEFAITASVWEAAASLGFALRRKGVTIPYMDLVIAAAAMESQAVLLHADSDFDRIAEHSELLTESLIGRI